MTQPAMAIPSLLAGRYRLEALAWADEQVEGYAATDTRTGRPVEVRALAPALAAEPAWIEWFVGLSRAGAPGLIDLDPAGRFAVHALPDTAPTVPPEAETGRAGTMRAGDPRRVQPARRGPSCLVYGLVATLVAVAALVAVLLALDLDLAPPTERETPVATAAPTVLATAVPVGLLATVPDITRQTVAEAAIDLRDAGLGVAVAGVAYRPHRAEGEIVSQEPAVGAALPPGSLVAVIVDSDSLVVVPDVAGKGPAAAADTIEAADLATGTVTRIVAADARGRVIATLPAAGARVARESVVAVVVSLGPDDAPEPAE